MWEKIVAFFMAIIAFFASLFGVDTGKSTEFLDLSYGSGEQQKLDLYLPENGGDNVGLYVMIHGGGWVSGSKEGDRGTCRDIAKNFGYAAMTINYRMFNYPAQGETVEGIIADPVSLDMEDMMDDITAALSCAVSKAAENGCRITNACLVGGSAGGHLSMMYAYKYKAASPVNIAFCVSYSGPADLADPAFCVNTPDGGMGDPVAQYLVSRLSHTYVTAENIGDPAVVTALQAVSPLYQVTPATVPTIICHGIQDRLVPYSGARRLDARLTECGVRHDFFTYPNSGHDLNNQADIDAIGDSLYLALISYCKDYFGY